MTRNFGGIGKIDIGKIKEIKKLDKLHLLILRYLIFTLTFPILPEIALLSLIV